MVIRAEPVVQAIEAARNQDPELHVIYLTPKGRPFNQNVAQELAEKIVHCSGLRTLRGNRCPRSQRWTTRSASVTLC